MSTKTIQDWLDAVTKSVADAENALIEAGWGRARSLPSARHSPTRVDSSTSFPKRPR